MTQKGLNLKFNGGVSLFCCCFTVVFPGSASPIYFQALLKMPPTVLSSAALSCFSSVLSVLCVSVCVRMCECVAEWLKFVSRSPLKTKIHVFFYICIYQPTFSAVFPLDFEALSHRKDALLTRHFSA